MPRRKTPVVLWALISTEPEARTCRKPSGVLLAAICVSAILSACDQKTKHIVDASDTDVVGVSFVSPEDQAAMTKAMADARAHLDVFLEELKKAEPGKTFAVKKPFPKPDWEYEHMWLDDVKIIEDGFEGRLDNTPRVAKHAIPGKLYTVKRNEISDWEITDTQGRIWGNYTVRVVLPRLPPEHRKHFEAKLQPLP